MIAIITPIIYCWKLTASHEYYLTLSVHRYSFTKTDDSTPPTYSTTQCHCPERTGPNNMPTTCSCILHALHLLTHLVVCLLHTHCSRSTQLDVLKSAAAASHKDTIYLAGHTSGTVKVDQISTAL